MTYVTTSRRTVTERIFDCFPSGTYALSGLLRLFDIVETTSIETAAVECKRLPRLLINPEFVEQHAHTPERLLMLVMHELHHVLLGHTTLFPSSTPLDNFIFDAVINGIICRMFPEPAYTSLLTEYYDEANFPQCLLRPPPGWPNRPRVSKGLKDLHEPTRKAAHELHKNLYSDGGATYFEVSKVLPQVLQGAELVTDSLLGGHGDEHGPTQGGIEHISPALFEAVREIVESWPQPPTPIRGRSLSDTLQTSRIAPKPHGKARAVLRKLIRRVARSGTVLNQKQLGPTSVPAETALPIFDRRAVVLGAMGVQALLRRGEVPWVGKVPSGVDVHIYLDVSGSMDDLIEPLYGALLDCTHFVNPIVHLFSTKLELLSVADLRLGVKHSTGGTDFACVTRHIRNHKVEKALVLTDGWVGKPQGSDLKTLSKVTLAVGLCGEDATIEDLREVADIHDHVPLPEVRNDFPN
jgi:hypothetical protein